MEFFYFVEIFEKSNSNRLFQKNKYFVEKIVFAKVLIEDLFKPKKKHQTVKMKLIILTRISLDDPTGYTDFEFYTCDEDELENTVKSIQRKIIKQNISDYEETYLRVEQKECPYKIGYIAPEYRKGSKSLYTRVCDNLSLLQNKEIFLIEEHTSHDFAFGITVKDLIHDRSFVLYEH